MQLALIGPVWAKSHLLSLIYRDAVSSGIYQVDQFHKVMLDGDNSGLVGMVICR
jgi:hypothetical protein